jgi:hypothetical protein
MTRRFRWLRTLCGAAIAAVAGLIVSCRDQSASKVSPTIVLATVPTESACAVPVTISGELQVTHCRVCGKSDVSGREDPVVLEGRFDLPIFATDATVFQNGWKARYLHGDQRVTAIASAVQDLDRQGRTLRWKSIGLLRDQNFDNAYEYCSTYTVLAWNRNTLRAAVNHTPRGNSFVLIDGDTTVTSNEFHGSALMGMRLTRPHPAEPVSLPQRVASVLPRGFQFFWTSTDVLPFLACFFPGSDEVVSDCGRDDNDLLQLAFNQDHGEGFLLDEGRGNAGGVTAVDSRIVSWVTHGIIKDNDTRHDYEFKSLASTFGGADIGVIQPPFSITPRNDLAGCINSRPPTVVSEDVVVMDVPFQVAVPMLTGWELSYCRDHHLREIGVWIDSFSYSLNPLTQTGTLRYRLSRVLRDDGDADFSSQHSVNILGFRPLTRLTHPDGPVVPD